MSSRRQQLGLAGSILLLAGSAAWLAHAWVRVARPSPERRAEATAETLMPSQSGQAVMDAGLLGGKDIFRPIALPIATPELEQTPAPRPVPAYHLPPAAFSIPPAWPSTPLPVPVVVSPLPTPEEPWPTTSPPPTPTPQPMNLAVTGVAGSGAARRVLVERNDTGETCWAQVGQEVFGYRVDYMTDRGAMLSRGGRIYVLQLGANKTVRPTPTPSGASEAAEQSGGGAERAAEEPTEARTK